MRFAILLVLLIAGAFSAPVDAFNRSLCKQYGGSANCWMPVIGPWKYGVCGEWPSGSAGALFEAAFCEAQGGTWNQGCLGLPPAEYRRPTSEGDMAPLALQTYTNRYEPLCEGPSGEGFSSWGAVYGSVHCAVGNGAQFNSMGYEVFNSATPFAATGKLQVSGVCNTTDTVIGFKGTRGRPVGCTSVNGGEDFISTSGGTPALCNLGFRQPTDPKQECSGCKSSVQVGNPIDPHSGVKRQVELDYAGSGPFPLRFERIYHNRVYTRDGKQWRHNYSAHIDNQEFGTVPVAMAHRANGQVFLFKLTAGQYLPDTDIDDRVIRLVDGGGALTGWQYYDASSDANELYDAEGKLLYIINRAGLAHTLEYSTAATPPATAPGPGYLIRVIDSFGRQLAFTHDMFGRLATMQDPAGQMYVYESTTQNHFASVTYPDSKTRSYLYNEAGFLAGNSYDGRLTGLVDENGVRFGSFYYDFFGSASRTTHPGGANNYVVNSGAWPSSVGVTDPRGTLRTYGYVWVNGAYRNSFIRQPAVSGSGTVQSNMTYTGQGNLLTRVDFNGNRTNYTSYDTARNLELTRVEGLTAAGATTPQTRTINTLWDTNFRLPTGIAEPLRITTNVYDADGTACGARGMLCSKSIQATTDANGSLGFSAPPTGTARTWTYTYNANGSLLSVNGPRTDVTDVTSYFYYANDDPDLAKRGQLESITNSAGHVTSFTAYNVHGQPTTIVDPNGLTTDLVYDLRRRLTSRTVGGEITIYDYDGVGNLDKVTLPDGSYLDYSYDTAHRLTGMEDNLGNKISYILDAMGNRTAEEVRDPGNNLAQTRTRVFNNLNRLFQEIGAASQTTQYAYDNQGNLTSVDGPLAGTGDTTTNAYDALNRLRQVTNPGSVVTQYAYNGLDALTRVTDPRNLQTNYTVDGLGNLTLQASPDTGNTTNTYDPAGNLLTQTDAKSQLTSYAYDALNRVTLITFHDGSKQTYAYDAGANGLGRLSSITETDLAMTVTGVIAYGYDQHGRVTSETRTIAGVPYATAYRYDSFGRRDRITYPSGRTVDLTFDTVGRVNSVSTTVLGGSAQAIATGVTYHPFGGVTGLTFGNSQAYSRTVDQDGRISSYSLGSQSFGIGFDLASRITGIAETGNPPNTNTYGYDLLDRITSAILPSTNYGYTYDGVGNRLTKVLGGNTDTYAYASTSNRIASVTPSSGPVRNFTLDANGSTTADGINTYAYDVRERMVQAVSSLGTTTYQVNALGQRVRKTNALGDRVFNYDSQGHLIAETTAAGATLKEYVWLGDMPLAVVNGEDRFYIHSDHLNTPRLVANQVGQAVWRWDQQEPFGSNLADENPSSLGTFEFPLRYPGQYADKETNLHYNYFRDYDAATGRYPQSDPIGLLGGINTYAYVSSNPLSKLDPNGLLVVDGSCSAAARIIIQEAERKVKTAAQTCIPCQDREKFLQKLETANVSCIATCKPPVFKGLEVDAYAQGGTSIYMTPCGINPQIGCVEATLVHEITHLIGYGDERVPRENEKRCFGCAPNRPPYP